MSARIIPTPFRHRVRHSTPVTRNMPALREQHCEHDRFVILSPPLRGLEMTLQTQHGQKQWTLGSSRTADFSIHDPSLLDTHLLIERLEEGVMLTCNPNGWGVLVNLEPLQMALVEDGDRIIVGRFEMVFVAASVASVQ